MSERPAGRRRRRWLRIGLVLVSGFAAIQALAWTEPQWLFSLLERLAPGIVWRVATSRPRVALSFDDGPSPVNTPRVLAVLREHHARATFFLIGQRAAAHPEVVRAIRAGGHEVGNHYLSRGVTLLDGPEEFRAKLERTEVAIGGLGLPKLYRPPSGLGWPWQLRAARESGYTVVLGSAYPHDPTHPSGSYMQWLVEKNLRPGAIVILHDGISDPSRTIQALPGILEAGRRRGLEFVAVGELLRER